MGADAVIVADALVGDEGQGAPTRRMGDVGHVRPQRRDGIGQHVLEDRVCPVHSRQSHHGRLLRHFAGAAEDGEAGRGLRPLQELPRFLRHRSDKRGIGGGIVEIGEGEVLPDQQAELVAERVKGAAFVAHGGADADHVHAGGDRQIERAAGRRGLEGEGDHVDAAPAGAAAEHGHAVDARRRSPAVGLAVDRDAAEADGPQRKALSGVFNRDGVERRAPMRVRPPGLDVRHDDRAAQPAVLLLDEGEVDRADAGDHPARRRSREPHGEAQHAVASSPGGPRRVFHTRCRGIDAAQIGATARRRGSAVPNRECDRAAACGRSAGQAGARGAAASAPGPCGWRDTRRASGSRGAGDARRRASRRPRARGTCCPNAGSGGRRGRLRRSWRAPRSAGSPGLRR